MIPHTRPHRISFNLIHLETMFKVEPCKLVVKCSLMGCLSAKPNAFWLHEILLKKEITMSIFGVR